MRIVLAGGTGFLGERLSQSLAARGDEVITLSRSGPPLAAGQVWLDRPGARTGRWSATDDTAGWGHAVNGADAVINLAGESIGAKRWTPEQKTRLESSRIDATRGIGRAIAAAEAPPSVLVNASAVGYYGDRHDEVLTEQSSPGTDFLGRLGARWEEEARLAASDRSRLILLRSGIVLDADGGALVQMMTPFKLGVGGRLGSGRQYMSWIHRSDWVAMVLFLLGRRDDGPFNVTAPTPVTNREFTRSLGAALGRPAIMPAPAFALRFALGEMADALLLGGQRVVPERPMALGFRFTYPTISGALAAIVR